MIRPWIQSGNVFIKITNKSNTKGVLICRFVDGKLAGVVSVATLYNQFHPLSDAYVTAYDEHETQKAVVKAKTQEVTDLFNGLVSAARDWDLAIQTKYAAKGTPDYTRLLPYGRSPFYSGEKEMRVRAINQLSLSTTGITVLAATHTNVNDYYTDLNKVIGEQRDEMAKLDTKKAALEVARIAACDGLDNVLGGLKQLFPNDPKRVDEFFPLDLIRTIPQKVFIGSIAKEATKNIVRRKQKPTSIIKIKNPGLTALHFYFASIKGGSIPVGTTPVIVQSLQAVSIPASDLGDLNNPFLTVYNPSDRVEGDYEVWVGN